MKGLPVIIILITSLLIAYGFYSFSTTESLGILIALVGFAYSCITLYTSFVPDYESNRIKTVIGFTGTAFFLIGIAILIAVMVYASRTVWVILPLGLLLMLYLGVIYFISRSGQ